MTSLLRLRLAVAWAIFAVSAVANWRSTGPYGASVESVVFAGPGLLALTSNAFLYRSTDSGNTWTLVPFPAQHHALGHVIAVDPKDPERSFAIGVSSSNNSIAGLYQTADGGKTWRHSIKDVAVFSALYAPSGSNTIAAGTRTGVLLSKDGGAAFTRISPIENKELQPVMSLGFDPANPAILYAGTPHLPWKTSDGGTSWTSIHHGMIDDSDILALTVNLEKPSQLFIGACSGIYRSDNSAGRWTKLLGITGAGFRTYAVALDKANPETVYSGTRDGLWRSLDLGKTWKKLAPNIVKRVAVSPADPKILFLATEDAGVLRSRDGGESFHDASTGLVDRRMVRLTHTGQHMLVTSGRDGSTQRKGLSETGWKRAPLPASNARILPMATELLAATNTSMWKSNDGGASWKTLPVLPAGVIATGVANGAPLAATAKAVYRLSANGLAWQPATALGASAGAIRRMHTARSGTGPVWIEAGASVWTSADAGKTWSLGALPPHDIYELDSSNAMILAATAQGVHRSIDGGKTWKACTQGIDGGSTTPAVAVDAANPARAFAVQYGRIFQTADAGETWTELPAGGLQGASIAALGVAGNELLVLTSARGVFQYPLAARANEAN